LRDITERTMRERELEAARRELEQSNERLEEFASVVSHDPRNPLNVASLRLELAQQEVDSDHLETVGRAHDRMESLVEDLLLLARGGTGVDEQTQLSLAAVADGSDSPKSRRGSPTDRAYGHVERSGEGVPVRGTRGRLR
jgi:signal transduction histidine kinase